MILDSGLLFLGHPVSSYVVLYYNLFILLWIGWPSSFMSHCYVAFFMFDYCIRVASNKTSLQLQLATITVNCQTFTAVVLKYSSTLSAWPLGGARPIGQCPRWHPVRRTSYTPCVRPSCVRRGWSDRL